MQLFVKINIHFFFYLVNIAHLSGWEALADLQPRVFGGVGIFCWFGCSPCLHYLILQKWFCALGCEMLFSFFFFLMLSLDVQENQKMMSVDTVWFWSSFEVTWGMCLKQEDDFSKGRDERGSLFYFKIKCEACVCCNKLFAQVNANGHVLYVRTKKKKKNMKNKKNAWAFSEAPGSLLCEQPDFLSNIVPVYSL